MKLNRPAKLTTRPAIMLDNTRRKNLVSVYINPADILKCFFTPDKTSVTYILIVNIRLPRMLGAIIAGMGLSVAGVILQGVMNNALASPNTIGVNSGAGFFVMLVRELSAIYASAYMASVVKSAPTNVAIDVAYPE